MTNSTSTPSSNTKPYLPGPRNRDAPETFKGDYRKIKTFLTHYERLLSQCNITSDEEKCQQITIYCNTPVKHFITVQESYIGNDWDNLKACLLDHYDADREAARYNLGDLLHFIHRSARKTIISLSDWKDYRRKFTEIAQWLKNEKIINETEYQTYLWMGLSKPMREKIETLLLAGNSKRDISQPFPINDITAVMQTLFHRQRFDAKRLRQKYSSTHHKYEESEAEESDDSGYDTDPESDSEEEDKKPKQKSSKQTKGKSHSPSPNASSTKPEPAKTTNSTTPKKAGTKDDSIDDLISKMSKLSINEPAYAVAYFKALTISPIISEVFARPIVRGNTSGPNQSNQDQVRNTPISQNNTNGNQPPITTYSRCLGCGSPEHSF